MTDIRRGQDAKLDENDPFRVIATMVPVKYSNNHDYISDTMRCPNRAECAPYLFGRPCFNDTTLPSPAGFILGG